MENPWENYWKTGGEINENREIPRGTVGKPKDDHRTPRNTTRVKSRNTTGVNKWNSRGGGRRREWWDNAECRGKSLVSQYKIFEEKTTLQNLTLRIGALAGKSISIQDYKYTDRAFSLSRSLPSGKKGVNDLPVSFYTDVLFNLDVRTYRRHVLHSLLWNLLQNLL